MSGRRFLYQLWKKAPTRPEIVILSSILSITTVSGSSAKLKLQEDRPVFCQPSFNPLFKSEVIVIRDLRSWLPLTLCLYMYHFYVMLAFGALSIFLDRSETFWTILEPSRTILFLHFQNGFNVSNFISEKYDDNGGSTKEKNDRVVF